MSDRPAPRGPPQCKGRARNQSADVLPPGAFFDFNVEFEVELAEVTESPHPVSGDPVRPWGGLDKRLQALHKAVLEYVTGLEAIALDLRDARKTQ